MKDEPHLSEIIAAHTAYRFIGKSGQFLMGVPARDLTEADLVEIFEREGITEGDVLQSGLYEASNVVEVEPFCGAPTSDGEPCRRTVARWGERCYQHKEEED